MRSAANSVGVGWGGDVYRAQPKRCMQSEVLRPICRYYALFCHCESFILGPHNGRKPRHEDITSDGRGHQGESSAADWARFRRAVLTASLELRNVRAGVFRRVFAVVKSQ